MHATMSLAPDWAQRMSGFHRPGPVQAALAEPFLQTYSRLLRWGFGDPPWARLARERAGVRRPAAPVLVPA